LWQDIIVCENNQLITHKPFGQWWDWWIILLHDG